MTFDAHAALSTRRNGLLTDHSIQESSSLLNISWLPAWRRKELSLGVSAALELGIVRQAADAKVKVLNSFDCDFSLCVVSVGAVRGRGKELLLRFVHAG